MHPAPVVMVNTIRIHIMIIQIYTLNTLNRLSYPTTTTTTTMLVTTSLIDTKQIQMHLHHRTLPLQQHTPQLPIPQTQPDIQLLAQGIISLMPKLLPSSSLGGLSHHPTMVIKITTIRNHTLPPLISIKNGEWGRSYHQYPACRLIKVTHQGTHMLYRHLRMPPRRLLVGLLIGIRLGII
jgi:hypothetical protein